MTEAKNKWRDELKSKVEMLAKQMVSDFPPQSFIGSLKDEIPTNTATELIKFKAKLKRDLDLDISIRIEKFNLTERNIK